MYFKNTAQRSVWELEAMSYPRDLIIIGSGITGLSTALFWKRKHPDSTVMVLDRGFWPTGATGRNAGFACFGSAGELLDDLSAEEEKSVKERLRLRLNGLELLKTELGENHIDYRQTGGWEIFDSEDDPHYRQTLAHLDRFSKWVEEITGEPDTYEPREINGFPAIYNRLEGCLHSGKMLNRLLERVMASGVEVRWNCPVHKVDGNYVELADGLQLRAERVMCALNGYTSKLIEKSEVKPARGYVMVTKPLKNLPWRGACHYNRGYVYFRNLGDRLLIGGARDIDKKGEESAENKINPLIKNWLVDFINQKLGIDRDWEIEQEWTGVMGFASSKSPEMKRFENGVYSAAGLGGMGVAIGMKIGERMAEMIR